MRSIVNLYNTNTLFHSLYLLWKQLLLVLLLRIVVTSYN